MEIPQSGRGKRGNYKGKQGLGVRGSGQGLVWPTISIISTTSAAHTSRKSGRSQIEAILQGYAEVAPVGQGIYELLLPLLEISAARQ